jgi:hypothetical protein
MPENKWARLLAYVNRAGQSETPLLQNEYLAAENRILRAHLPARRRLSDLERSTLAESGKRLGRAALQQVACIAKPETILAWYRRLIARKFDGSKLRTSPGRPRTQTHCALRQRATSFADTGSSQHPSGAIILPGRISSPPTWRSM